MKRTPRVSFSPSPLFSFLPLPFLLFRFVVSCEYYARSTVDYFVLFHGVTFDEKRIDNVGRGLLRRAAIAATVLVCHPAAYRAISEIEISSIRDQPDTAGYYISLLQD